MPRPRATVEHDLADATSRRDHATRTLDFDAYQNLTEQIVDLQVELHALFPEPRRPVARG